MIPSSAHLLEVHALTKKYDDTTALHHLSLTLMAGEILGLLGPNGAGKTSAIHIFLGILSPTSGTVSVLGFSPLEARHKISQHLNFSSAYVHLPSNLKVIENLKIFAGLYRVIKPRNKINELLELFEIGHLAGRLTGALSSGEKTRLNLCKCLLNDPQLLLLDEPTASLDPEMADDVRRILRRIQKERKMGILYTSHNMREVEEMCDRVLFIHHGKAIEEGTPAALLAKHGCQNLEDVFIKIVRGE